MSVGGLAASLVLACSPGSASDKSRTVDREEEELSGAGGSGTVDPRITTQSRVDMLYELPPPPGCGDFSKGADEECDDGNLENGDGCSGNCLVVEDGYQCPVPGSPCELAEVCGDSRRILSETCDDGNAVAGDGCASNCRLENGYACPEPGQPCVSTVVCSDGFVSGAEECDDSNAVPGDGCSDLCVVELGYECLIQGGKCRTVCGDGLVRGVEQCDDGLAPTPGCSAICRLEPGFVCNIANTPCEATTCGDGVEEGTEQCDDDNLVPYDSCAINCVNEPVCGDDGGGYTCQAVCGDGMKFPEEGCDDGNEQSGDGCSADCLLEPDSGFECDDQAADLGNAIALPIIYRDFRDDHPHFEIDPGPGFINTGMVLQNLGPNGKPAFNPAFSFDPDGDGVGVTPRAWTLDGRKPANGGAAPLAPAAIATLFSQWYVTDVTGANNVAIIDSLLLAETPPNSGTFQFSASGVNNFFFPLDPIGGDEQGFGNQGRANNFHFTSEVRQWFEFQGGEFLEFRGDDDVWVFVNGRLAVDLGGIHSEVLGSIELSNIGDDSQLCVQSAVGVGAAACDIIDATIDVPVATAGVNEIVVFQAERHITQSNYTLTIQGFNAPVTTCVPRCGNAIVTPDESCDDGDGVNGSGYGFCNADCTPGPRCGDGIVNGPEQCDNGANREGYSLEPEDCAPGCILPSSCGDGVIDAAFGELCDDGVDANDNSYGGCNAECLLGPRCGDNEINGVETCDDGNRQNTDGCNLNCELERDPA